LCAIKLVFVSSLRLDVTDRLEPEIREIFSSALLISEKCSEICKFGSGKGFASKSGSFEPVKELNFTKCLHLNV
ncbi:hypothetical protein KTQ96_15345, partial [Prevotella copri]|uniref:hypothetical protein n=1 Tax=Segatella copri TaxID=165179 RepID=UPI001C2B8082